MISFSLVSRLSLQSTYSVSSSADQLCSPLWPLTRCATQTHQSSHWFGTEGQEYVHRSIQTLPLTWKNKAILTKKVWQLPLSIPKFMLERVDGAGPEGKYLHPSSFPPGESGREMHEVCLLLPPAPPLLGESPPCQEYCLQTLCCS